MAERRSAVTGTPIIIVPAAPSSIINMFNVKRFLEDGVHVDTATAKAASNGTKPSKVQVIGKTKDGKKLKFNVIDNVALLGDERQWCVAALLSDRTVRPYHMSGHPQVQGRRRVRARPSMAVQELAMEVAGGHLHAR